MPDHCAGAGRYAPSPSGDLHLGNLRTALVAWALARSERLGFVMRMEDLNRVQEGSAQRQLEDLHMLGIDWDGEVTWQSRRLELYERVGSALAEHGLVYECYCTRKEILEAPQAPHSPPGAYPGTCRDLSDARRVEGRAKMAALHRAPALRLRADTHSYTVHDRLAGEFQAEVDDFVLRRGDGLWAYNLVVVVDDIEGGITQVVRGDDLLPSTPRQAYLIDVLAQVAPWLWPTHGGGSHSRMSAYPSRHIDYVHVPLAVNVDGVRLAKRDGAVTLRERLARGQSPGDVVQYIGDSLGLAHCRTAGDIRDALIIAEMERKAWVVRL